jgi:hypothetical protein
MKHFVVFILFALSADFLFAQNPEAMIREMSGTVELKTNASADWVTAQAGDRIGKNTIVSTGFKSIALLVVGNSTITVRPLTRMSLAELMNRNETETININLNTGRVRVDVNPPVGGRANFIVQTPSAVASVRGTMFNLNTDAIQVLKGAVNYKPANGTYVRSVMVNAHQESRIDTDTGSAVHPMAAAKTARGLPDLPGQDALPSANNGAQLEVPGGTITVDVTFGNGD